GSPPALQRAASCSASKLRGAAADAALEVADGLVMAGEDSRGAKLYQNIFMDFARESGFTISLPPATRLPGAPGPASRPQPISRLENPRDPGDANRQKAQRHADADTDMAGGYPITRP